MRRFGWIGNWDGPGFFPVAGLAAAAIAWGAASVGLAGVTSQGQLWDETPDAWVRDNTAETAYFGWDVFEGNGPTLSFGRVLDDATPDLGVGTTATGTRLFQGIGGAADPSPTAYGHRSGTANYYSGFGDADLADDRIQGTAPGGSGGFTTVVLQVVAGAPGGNGAQALDGMNFAMETAGWTLAKSLYGQLATETGLYWEEWYAAGGNVPFSIHMTSSVSSRSIDAISVDTHWSADQPALNALTAIGVPEPAGIALLGAAAMAVAARAATRRVTGR